ncbi:MFS transporter [Candidatus Microgenomates bacterium]|nr:MFS transporter [Candidatus Microgenomates bacterium]
MSKNFKELLFLHFLNDGTRTSFVVLLPFIAKDLSLNFTSVGFLGSSQPLLAAILALPAGFITARIGGFRLLTILLITYSIAALAAGLSISIFFLLPAFLLGALGFGMFHTVGFALVAGNSDKSNMGRNMGNFTSLGEIGRVALPPLAIFTTASFGWRPTMVILAVIGFSSYLFFRSTLSNQERLPKQTSTIENYREFLKNTLFLLQSKKLRLVTLAGLLDAFASNPLYLFLPFLLLLKGVTASQLGGLMAAFFAGSLAGKFLLGRGIDKFGTAKIFILSELSMAGLLVGITLTGKFLLLLFLLAFLLGIFTKGTSPVMQAMFSTTAANHHYHRIYAVSTLFLASAELVAIMSMGPAADILGINVVFYLCAVFAVLAVIPVLALKKTTLATAAKVRE